MLAQAGLDVDVGGNIGKAVFLLRQPARDRVYVLELSSFQIDLMPGLAPSVGILTNLTPDHLDRHGSMQAYTAAKARILAPSDGAVVAPDPRLVPGDRRLRALRDATGTAPSGVSSASSARLTRPR